MSMAIPIQQAARNFVAKDMQSPELHHFSGGQVVVFTRRCPDKETVNEDSSAIIPYSDDSGVLIVADGAGGLPAGSKASETAIQSIRHILKQSAKKDLPLRSAILDGIEEANNQVLKLGIGAATTLAVVEITPQGCRTYHVGDSQIIVMGGRGKLKLQTISHSPVGYAVESGMISTQEALQHEERHLVSNMIGAHDMRIEVGSFFEMSQMDTIVIASDGLYDNATADEITECMSGGQLISNTEQLVSLCDERMLSPRANQPSKPDDLTILAYRRVPSR